MSHTHCHCPRRAQAQSQGIYYSKAAMLTKVFGLPITDVVRLDKDQGGAHRARRPVRCSLPASAQANWLQPLPRPHHRAPQRPSWSGC